ncbi:MAG: 30S ribosomal protein S5 [Patescibacteria group bacterium]|nr:30S ribosomal protein S5 [Patescibacteria group bacterium]
MTEEKEKKVDNKETEVKKDEKVIPDLTGDDEMKKTPVATKVVDANKKPRPARVFKKNNSFRRKRPSRPRSEFDQKIIKIRRVTRVVKGGRRFSFSVAIVIGNRKGSVGVGVAKGADVALAVEKAVKKAKKDLIKLKLTNNKSIPHDVESKYCSSIVKISPTKEGRGLSAGSATKNVLELAGITDVTAKIISRSRNKLNIAMSTLEGLKEFKI